jgi:hypothetical protein
MSYLRMKTIELERIFRRAYDYAVKQGCSSDDSTDYATWYMRKFPQGEIGHNDERAFYAWTIRRAQ